MLWTLRRNLVESRLVQSSKIKSVRSRKIKDVKVFQPDGTNAQRRSYSFRRLNGRLPDSFLRPDEHRRDGKSNAQ
jgi:hypothetical protein